MTWYRADVNLAHHVKTIRLQRRLGVPLVATVGLLHMLWAWATVNHPDGDLSRVDADDLALVLGWDGDPDELLAALKAEGTTKRGFLDPDGRLHDWDEYQHVVTRVRAKSGSYGAHVRHHERAGVVSPDCDYCTKPSQTTDVLTGANVCQLAKPSKPSNAKAASSKPVANLANADLPDFAIANDGTAIAKLATGTGTDTGTSNNQVQVSNGFSISPENSKFPGQSEPPAEPDLDPDPTTDDGFDGFWDAYPKRDGSKGSKAEAKAAWGRLSKAARGRAMTAVGHYATWCEASGRYPKDAVRFIRPVRGSKTALFEEWQDPRPVDRPADLAAQDAAEANRFNPEAWV